jgi:hypothetical protein
MHTDLEHEQAIARVLRGLAGVGPQPYDWAEFQRRARRAPQPALGGGRAAAAAAVIAVVACAVAIRLDGPGSRAPHAPAATDGRAAPGAQLRGELLAARTEDASAERWLASLPAEPAVVRVGTRAAVATLEDHIAQVDDLLSAARAEQTTPARLLALQQQRVLLVSSLVQVRYAETLADESR